MDYTLSFREAKTILKLHVRQQLEAKDEKSQPMLVPLLIGKHGNGKSWMVREIADELTEERVINLRLSEMPEGELGGIPHVTEDGKMFYATPPWWRTDWEDKPVIVFVDEINRVQRYDGSVQMLHKFLNERKIHEKELPRHWPIVAAANPENGDYQVHEMLADWSFRTRVKVYHVLIEFEEWVEWAKKDNNIHPLIVEYFSQHREAFNTDQNVPRCIHEASQNLRYIEKIGAEDLIFHTLLGSIPDNALDFSQFYRKNVEILRVEDILKYTKEIRERVQRFVESGRSDVLMKAINGLLTTDADKVEKNINNVFSFLLDLPKELSYYYFNSLFLSVPKSENTELKKTMWVRVFAAASEHEGISKLLDEFDTEQEGKNKRGKK